MAKKYKHYKKSTIPSVKVEDAVQSNQLKCDVCGSADIIEAPHMGINCNDCNPL